ncbi:hypothetical protein CDD83_2787 [Cordyceps sp. RAO-2017]|nr:hypothetical protein CDD83_2787 [Cordyceps sp. RAO-2017]
MLRCVRRRGLVNWADKVHVRTRPLHDRTAAEIRDLIREGGVTVEQYARDLIARFDERDGEIHAWAHFDREGILLEAKRLDGLPTKERGPLHGVAVGIKDIFLTKGE